jgi:RNA polymerase sigma factor (sigma-70 family)
VDRARAEQESVYVAYVRARSLTLRRVAYRLCGEWHAAEDLVQKALVLLYRHWQQANMASSLDACVRRMLVNVYLDDRRGWSARRETPVADPQLGIDRNASVPDGRLDLLAASGRIAPGQRAVLVLRYWEQLSVAETAEALDAASAQSRIVRCLRRSMDFDTGVGGLTAASCGIGRAAWPVRGR